MSFLVPFDGSGPAAALIRADEFADGEEYDVYIVRHRRPSRIERIPKRSEFYLID